MPAPSWLLLAWSGFAATCAAALAGALIGGSGPATWALVPAQRSAFASFVATLLAGAVAYPLVYGAIFETVARADVRLGLFIGVPHALIAGAVAWRSGGARTAARLALVHLVYALAVSFLYVTP